MERKVLGKKLKALAIANLLLIAMVLSVFTVALLVVNDEASASHGAPNAEGATYGLIPAFSITAPANNTFYQQGDTVNITWGTATGATAFNITVKFWDGTVEDGTIVHYVNLSNQTGPGKAQTGYDWITNGSTGVGMYTINITAYNSTTGNETNATGNENFQGWKNNQGRTIYIYHGTPGFNAWQGCNVSLSKKGSKTGNADNILSTKDIDFRSDGTTSYNINVNASQNWSAVRYYLWQPQYNGTNVTASQYSMRWTRTTYSFMGNSLSGNEFEGVTFDRAGIYLINPDPNTDTETNADFSTWAQMNSTVAAWFWVNTSTNSYTLTSSATSFSYNSTGQIELNVADSGGTAVDCIVDIRYDGNESSIADNNKETGTGSYVAGQYKYYKNNTYFWNAGNYSAYAYKDTDYFTYSGTNYYSKYLSENMEKTAKGNDHWNLTYGADSDLIGSANWISPYATKYNWTLMGPWDPPEQNVTPTTIRVTTGTPYTSVSNATQYYGFAGEVNITIAETDGGTKFIDSNDIMVNVYNPDDVNVTQYFEFQVGSHETGNIDKSNDTTTPLGYIKINSTAWGKDGTTHIGDNGTWYAYISIDTNSDRIADNYATWTEEWNATVEWTVGVAPSAQFQWIDDDGSVGGTDLWGYKNKNTDGIIPYVPGTSDVPLDVEFQIRDTNGGYFGDLDVAGTQMSGNCKTLRECAENITISGNSLFTGTLDKFPGFDASFTAWGAADVKAECGFASDTTWHVPIIPTMSAGGNGGTITVKYTAYNTTQSQTLTIGGTEYGINGSVVSVTPSSFNCDEAIQDIIVTATNAETGADLIYNWAYLYYINDTGSPYTTHQVNRAYLATSNIITFNKTQQTTNQSNVDFDGDGVTTDTTDVTGGIRAPRNLTIYVDGPGRRDGYALITMDKLSDFKVEIYPETMMAGYKYSKFYINTTIYNASDENSTETPNTLVAEKNKFYLKIINVNGKDVTTSTINKIDAMSDVNGANAYSFVFTNAWATDPGPFTIYAYNHTHDSTGHNATLTVKQAEVTCDKTPLIWKSDDNISATFTVQYDGEPVSGKLRIDNMTLSTNYNKSWSLTNFTGTSDQANENTSITINEANIDANGQVTINDITPDHLDTSRAERNITFWFKPASPNAGAYARCIGKLPVVVPIVTPSPMYIPLGKTSKVKLTTSGRDDNSDGVGDPLADIFVGLDGRGISIATTNGTTGSDGSLTLSVTPSTAGNMNIHVGEDGRVVNTKVIVTAWVLDVTVSPTSVNEGDQFTVTVKRESDGELVEDATVTVVGLGSALTSAEGTATFTAPTDLSSDRDYTITATAEGYAEDPLIPTVRVVNIPQLTASAKPNPSKQGATVTVTVSKDDATPAVNALVKLEGSDKEYFTGGDGTVKITAPSKDGDYTITASFSNFVDGTTTLTVKGTPDGQPGFELLTLIIAIGIAFILVKRRRK